MTKNIDKFLGSLVEKIYSPSEHKKKEFYENIKDLNYKQKQQLALLFYEKLNNKKQKIENLYEETKSVVKQIKEKKEQIKDKKDVDKLLDQI